eukprot:scaffold2429_cov165-Amphora_coffeaeformis.AAC.12
MPSRREWTKKVHKESRALVPIVKSRIRTVPVANALFSLVAHLDRGTRPLPIRESRVAEYPTRFPRPLPKKMPLVVTKNANFLDSAIDPVAIAKSRHLCWETWDSAESVDSPQYWAMPSPGRNPRRHKLPWSKRVSYSHANFPPLPGGCADDVDDDAIEVRVTWMSCELVKVVVLVKHPTTGIETKEYRYCYGDSCLPRREGLHRAADRDEAKKHAVDDAEMEISIANQHHSS